MSIFGRTRVEEKPFSLIIIFLLLSLFFIGCAMQKNSPIDYCDFSKQYKSVIHFGQLPKDKLYPVNKNNAEKDIDTYLKGQYQVKFFEKKDFYRLDSENIVFDYVYDSESCDKVTFFGIYNSEKHKTLVTHLKYSENKMARWEIIDDIVVIYKKTLIANNSDFIEKNTMPEFYFDLNKIAFTLDDQEEFSKW